MKSLFDTTYINSTKLKNRFIRSATQENMTDPDGHMTDKLFNLYRNLSSGGTAMIIMGCSSISRKQSNSKIKMLGIYNDSFIDELKKLTDMVHENKCKISMEIALGDKLVLEDKIVNTEKFSNNVSRDDIDCIIKSFGNAASRIKKSGFDAVEIDISLNYFLGKTLSKNYNIRTDEYGGNFENRKKLLFEVYREIRNRIGKKFNIFVKIDSLNKESISVCYELDRKGINAIEIGSNNMNGIKIDLKEYSSKVPKIAENVKCSIISGLFNRNMINMNDKLNSTSIEYFSMSRPFICEPDLINKWLSGATMVSSCVSCGNCMSKDGIRCIHSI